ncbi:helix-turn-helix domain-containing protein [Paramicrobacterium humi]|uniref:helix-turn-helix domain-containing protein n=1 Tax=Paramicrobacterium humi TaxID=640635 RepID=UPI0015A0BE5F|nr:helix-turn-helix transcriptional regulator [Microbacterium humi]
MRTARRYRRLTQKELARISGVSAATLSRIESGQVDPAYGTVVKLLRTLGFKPGPDLLEQSTDDQILAAILVDPSLNERFDVYRVAAQVSPVAARVGARAVTADLGEMAELLESSGTTYAFSALEGFYGGWSERGPQSFWPVVYIDAGFEQPWHTQPMQGARGTVYTLPLTENASRFVERVNTLSVMSPDWSIIDTIASPDRQSDVGLDLLEAIGNAEKRPAA